MADTDNPVTPATATDKWICQSCKEECGQDEGSCKKCGFCFWCCDSWNCNKCKKQFCGDINLRCDSCAYCKECCSCWKCDGCNRPQPSQVQKCKVCNLCQNGCCHCFHCNRCAKTYLNFANNGCRDCRYCNECCQCSGIDRYAPENIMFHKAQPVKGFKRNPSSRFISMEIEIANVKNDKKRDIFNAVKHWQGAIVDDGSLPTTGFEINTSPSQGDKFCEQIDEVCKALESQGAIVSNQCGLHVHVDARDYTYYDLRRLLLLYSRIENGLFEVVAPERRHSKYCIPCSSAYTKSLDKKTWAADETKRQILRNVYQIEPNGMEKRFMQSVRGQKYNGARYNALNIHSWFYRGTIENRMHQGSKDAKHITNWGILWAGILDFALKNTEKKILEFSMNNEHQFKNLVEIAPTAAIKDWLLARAVTFKKRTQSHESSPRTTYTNQNEGYGALGLTATINANNGGRTRAVPPLETQNGAFDYDVDLPADNEQTNRPNNG